MRLIAISIMVVVIAFAFLNYSSTPPERPQSEEGANIAIGSRAK